MLWYNQVEQEQNWVDNLVGQKQNWRVHRKIYLEMSELNFEIKFSKNFKFLHYDEDFKYSFLIL